jgi:hypothetical protein
MQVITGKEQIQGARALTLRQGLRMELVGMKRRGRSCYSIIKEEFGFKGNKEVVFESFTNLLKARGILV